MENIEEKYIMNDIQFFQLEKNNKILFWLGVKHSWDEKHPQFYEIKEKWESFIKIAQVPVIVVENFRNEDYKGYKNEEESIKDNGEVGIMVFLASRSKIQIPIKCFEPNRHYEMNYIAEIFGKEKTEYYYFGRAIAQYYRSSRNLDIEEYIIPYLERDKKASVWLDFEFTISHLKQIHKNLFGNELDLNDKNWFWIIEDPTNQKNPLKEIPRASGIYRDNSIIDGVKSSWRNNDIFMVYGNGHCQAHKKLLVNI